MKEDLFDDLRKFPYFERACEEVDEIVPEEIRPVDRDDVRRLMILAWLRGAAWHSHGQS